MTYGELREMAYSPTVRDGDILSEMTELFMNEAYYGRKKVAKMQAAMDRVRDAYFENPNIDMTNAPENKALEKAIVDCFGFKSCFVYWANMPSMKNGPFTTPSAHIMCPDGPYIKMGENVDGVYDKQHKIQIAISSDLVLFSDPWNVTSEEMVGIFLHEIGHNFDYTMFGLMKEWVSIIEMIDDIIDEILKGEYASAAGTTVGYGIVLALKNQPELLVRFNNVTDMLINVIPPVGDFIRTAGRYIRPVTQLINTVMIQARWVTSMPITIMMMPVRLLSRVFLRKGEIYADSFSAAYGYAAEQMNGLEKMTQGMQTTNLDAGPISAVFNDLSVLYYDVFTTFAMGHGSTQQRALRMMDTFEQDLKKADLPPAQRAAIIAERDRVLKEYNRFVNYDANTQQWLTHLFRSLVDNWYNGKSSVIPEINKNYVG